MTYKFIEPTIFRCFQNHKNLHRLGLKISTQAFFNIRMKFFNFEIKIKEISRFHKFLSINESIYFIKKFLIKLLHISKRS